MGKIRNGRRGKQRQQLETCDQDAACETHISTWKGPIRRSSWWWACDKPEEGFIVVSALLVLEEALGLERRPLLRWHGIPR